MSETADENMAKEWEMRRELVESACFEAWRRGAPFDARNWPLSAHDIYLGIRAAKEGRK